MVSLSNKNHSVTVNVNAGKYNNNGQKIVYCSATGTRTIHFKGGMFKLNKTDPTKVYASDLGYANTYDITGTVTKDGDYFVISSN
jgi:glucan biosynthesis protein